MSPYLYLPLICLAAVVLVMSIAWIWATRIQNASVVDVFWAINFAIIAIIIFFLADGSEQRIKIVCGLSVLWSIRLSLHLSIRVFGHLDEEEGRYKQLRQEWAKNVNLKFFTFFQAQALSNVLLSIPFFIIALNPSNELSTLEYIGAGLWLLSIIGEGVSDWQLQNFKKSPANKGKVCDVGLWYYSRHPNYFFQLMIWISITIFAISAPYGWLSLISPLSIGYLLFNVTGIPMTEEQSLRSRGDLYREYQRSTSAFIPWFKKTGG